MKIRIDCTWNNKKNRAKADIHFDSRPKALFNAKEEDLQAMHKALLSCKSKKPSALRAIKEFADAYPKSLYIQLYYHSTLVNFERKNAANAQLEYIKEHFLGQLITKCLIGESFLRAGDYKTFASLFENLDVLKAAYPKRRAFHFEEAMFFHNLWGYYHHKTGNEEQAKKHADFSMMLISASKQIHAQRENAKALGTSE